MLPLQNNVTKEELEELNRLNMSHVGTSGTGLKYVTS